MTKKEFVKRAGSIVMIKRGRVITLTSEGWIDSKGKKVKSTTYKPWSKKFSNPPRSGSKLIYDKIISIEAQKGKSSLWPKEYFRHDFKKDKTAAKIIGNPDGSLTIRSTKGKRLWKEFDY